MICNVSVTPRKSKFPTFRGQAAESRALWELWLLAYIPRDVGRVFFPEIETVTMIC